MTGRRCVVSLLLFVLVASTRAAMAQHPNIEKGFKADNAYSFGDVDAINLFNGNLNVGIPIGGTYSAGGGLSYSFTLAYAGNNWEYETKKTWVKTFQPPPAEPKKEGWIKWAVPYKLSNAGMGWLFSLGRMPTPLRWSTDGPIYQAPDGSEHTFHPQLHGTGSAEPDVTYSRDGTYIRHTALREGTTVVGHTLEFGDGTIKEFAADGMLTKMYDRIGNTVTVTPYATAQLATSAGVPAPNASACGSSYRSWKISDPHRVHYIYFLPPSPAYSPFFEERVCQASLAAFAGSRANYLFAYVDRVISRQYVGSEHAYDPAEVPSNTLSAPLLKKIELPHGAAYEMLYDAGIYQPASGPAAGVRSDNTTVVPNQMSDMASALNPGGFSGHLMELRVPSGGRYEWLYRRYNFPAIYPSGMDPAEAEAKQPPSLSVGVGWRKKYVTEGAPDVWTYSSSLLGEGAPTATVAVTKVEAPPLDGAVTENYFSVYMLGDNERNFDYAAPYTRRASTALPVTSPPFPQNPHTSTGMFLSTKTTIPGVANPRLTYATYEWDPNGDPREPKDNNRRLKSSLTVFEDGQETRTVYSDFDGLGHYRTATTTGTAGPVSRVTWKNYNPTTPANGVRTIDSDEKWLTETYDTTQVTDLDPSGAIVGQTKTKFCFDPLTGRLMRTRSLRNAAAESTADLLAVFQDVDVSGAAGSIDGNVSQEEYYGGDDAPLASGLDTCTGTLTNPPYGLLHEYEFGSRKSTKYKGWSSFKILDLTIDDDSGLPSSVRDIAGVGTTLSYDLLGRLTSIGPTLSTERRVTSKYLYTNATASARPSVTALHECPADAADCVGADLPEARYYYDTFGRLVQQRSSMGTAGLSPWSASTITYDSMGRKKTSSVPLGVSSGSFGAISPPGQTTWSYDGFGRPETIAQPDTSTVTFAYTGANVVARTAKTATSSGIADVTTIEKSDALGRLVEVTEDSNGTPIQTSYQYDTRDRLIHVSAGGQTRTFDYDGAGLLTEEDHPESDPVRYTYDARGHMVTRITDDPAVTHDPFLIFDYDSAERLKSVAHDPDGNDPAANPPSLGPSTMKEFGYGSSGTALGRLLTAKRYNYNTNLGGTGIATVTETFSYDGAGRLSSKQTAVALPGSSLKTFTDSYTYNSMGATETITYPGCPACGFTPEARTVTNVYRHGFLQAVTGYAANIQYHPNGMWAQFTHPKVGGGFVTETQTLATNAMPRPETRSLTGHCSLSVTGPVPAKTVEPNGDSDLSVVAPAGSSYQWYEGQTAIPGQTGSALHVPVTQSTTYWVRVAKGGCTVDSSVSTVTVACGEPTVSVPSSIKLGAAGEASVAQAGTYSWSIVNGSIHPGTNTQQTVQFTAGCSGNVTLTVSFTPSCGGPPKVEPRSIPIQRPTVQLSASPEAIAPGGSTTLTVNVSGTGPWTIGWADLLPDWTVNGSHNGVVSPETTTTYEVELVNGCPAAPSWAAATVTVVPPAPLTTSATKSGATSVHVTWTKAPDAVIDSYRIERCASSCNGGGNWTLAGTSGSMSFSDGGRSPNSAYAYRVVSVRAGTLSAGASPPDFASTYAFSDDPAAVDGPARAVHLTELRSAVNALRAVAGLGAYSYEDTMAAGLTIKALHFQQLREALNGARLVFGAGTVTFSPPEPAIDTILRASHLNDLRGGVQ